MDLPPLHALFLLTAGAVTGLLGAILGTGGGVFPIPILVILLGVPMIFTGPIIDRRPLISAPASTGSSSPSGTEKRNPY